jgi:L-seryl-tRNA(Ser) seleniumtransferase
VISSESTVGGGSLPGTTLPTYTLAFALSNPNAVAATLRKTNPPIIARIQNNLLLFDPRTVLPEQDAVFLDAARPVLSAFTEG